ncbi:MAG: hypothetical protein AB7I19_18440 [Planctomycetota bacterium]
MNSHTPGQSARSSNDSEDKQPPLGLARELRALLVLYLAIAVLPILVGSCQ